MAASAPSRPLSPPPDEAIQEALHDIQEAFASDAPLDKKIEFVQARYIEIVCGRLDRAACDGGTTDVRAGVSPSAVRARA